MANGDTQNPIQHVFVLMLENRSFDHMFALSGIPGIHAATSANFNSYKDVTYHFGAGAPESMPNDPLHDFCDVLMQLCGDGADCNDTSPYPARTNGGFVENYATTEVNSGIFGHKPLPQKDWGKIMLGVTTPVQAPALYTLATEYALCDQYYSSLPGPTWPNRFFVHGASSDGMSDAPSTGDILKWEVFDGFVYPNGSIYDRLGPSDYLLYRDDRGPLAGRIPQVAALQGLSYFDVGSLEHFERDLADGYVARYTFIEPAYGEIINDTYRPGSSQHPMDGIAPGDRLVARVYNAIRNSPLWDNSLLIVTYDEHGGFYDSGIPAQSAPPPNDGTGPGQNTHNFDFSVYGVRVPALVVSPWVAKGGVDHGLYDHGSVLATVERLYGLAPLTDRDAKAQDLRGLLTDQLRPDSDCPRFLPEVEPPADALEPDEPAGAPDEEPIEASDNLPGFLFVARKAHRRLVGDRAALTRFQQVRTRGDARRYLEEVMPQLEAARAAGFRG